MDTKGTSRVGRVTPCAPLSRFPGCGARGATRPAIDSCLFAFIRG